MKLIPPLLGLSMAVLLALSPPQACAQAAAVPPVFGEAAPPANGDVVISITEQTYSLSVADADRLLQDLPTDDARHARLREMAAAGKAKLERLLVLRTKSGQRAVVENVFEYRFATEFDPRVSPMPAPEAGKDKPAEAKPEAKPAPAESSVVTPTGFETRNVGDTLEVEPAYDPASNSISLIIVPQIVRLAGERAMNGHPSVKQPIFETSKITTAVRVRDGQPYFLGTLNPYYGYVPEGQQPREPRVWLDFVTASVVRPDAPPAVKPKGAQNGTPEISWPRSQSGWRPMNTFANTVLSRKITAMAAKAQGIILPMVEFHEVTIEEAVDDLRAQSRALDREQKGVNIVFQPGAKPGEGRITARYSNIPLDVALRYTARLAGMAVEENETALIVQPAGGGH